MIAGKLKFSSIEKVFFFAIAVLNLIPAFASEFFATMDGAAHLYNSRIITELLVNSNSALADFFSFNSIPVPNWTGHFILSLFNLFLPANYAEKILVIIYLIGLPYSFRYLVKKINPDNMLLSYFIFPFTYSFLFLLGFYNFSLALVFLFFTLGFWMDNEKKDFTKGSIFILFLLITLTYFSHAFVFAILLFLLAAHIVFNNFFQHLDQLGLMFSNIFKRLKVLVIASFIPVLLFLYYIYSTHTDTSNLSYVSPKELMEWLKNLRPLIVYNSVMEEAYTKKIVYLLALLCVIAVYDRINLILNRNEKLSVANKIYKVIKYFFALSDFWLIAAGAFLYLYFKLPDSDGNAGYVSVRLGLLFFLILILWLSSKKIPQWFSLTIISLLLFCHFSLNNYYTTVLKDLGKMAFSCNSAAKQIAPGSIVLPLNYSDNWLVGHFSNYLGAEKPMIILENYECSAGYFPLKWNESKIPNLKLGTIHATELSCTQWKSNPNNPEKMIDYVFIFGNIESKTDPCNLQIKNVLLEHYTLIDNNEHTQLYAKK